MLKSLSYSVTFTNPERTISRDLNFKTGLTAITGPNGMGKSLVLEMVQYALFGTKALRAGVKDYKKISTVLLFQVRDKEYSINRDLKSVVLKGESELIASGTTAVNAAILSIFGYSYEVFKVANVAGQGQIEALGNMLPTERKRLVDETIGLNALDELTTYIQAEARDLAALVKATEAAIVEPIKPVDPELEPSSHYASKVAELNQQRSKRDIVLSVASRDIGPAPKDIPPEPDADKREQYIAENKAREELLTEQRLLTRDLGKLKQVEYVEVELDAEDGKLEEYQKEAAAKTKLETILSALPPAPHLHPEELMHMEGQHKLQKRWVERNKLRSTRVEHNCPSCKHHWADEDPRIKAEYGDVPETLPSNPLLLPMSQIQKLWAEHDSWPKRKEIEAALAELPDDYAAIVKRILAARTAFKAAEVARTTQVLRQTILDRLAEIEQLLSTMPDRTACIERLRGTELAIALIEERKGVYAMAAAQKAAAMLELDKFSDELDCAVATAMADLQTATTYEAEFKRYSRDAEVYVAKQKELEELRGELKDWENGKKAVVDLRARVKGYLLPSLNAAASHLINEMTGGELSWVVVDEDFNITVEGQKLETLSGSGKAVANLALRLSLGQILTNQVFSCVLLDEIDASCDSVRARYISECLQRLTRSVKQTLLVSHKDGLTADQHIRLGE